MNHRKEHTDICENVYVHMQYIYKILAFFTFYPMCVGGHACHGRYVRGQSVGVGSFLLPMVDPMD